MANKPTFIIAGPGAGKTHGMVNKIEESIGDLNPCRQLAAVTYTNAAAEVIRRRLAKRTALPRNMFIGTTHSFIARYILRPFATLLDELPEERIYCGVEIKKTGAARNAILKNLRNKGVVSYEAMLSTAAKIIQQKPVRDLISNRLQCLFVDEFQDVDSRQLKIFDALRKAKKTKIFVVGDPEQYISGHTYRNSGRSVPAFDKLPFAVFRKSSTIDEEPINWRANGELVDFANQFRSDLEQTPKKPYRKKQSVLFLKGTSLEKTIENFQIRSKKLPKAGERISRLYLARNNDAYDDVRHKFNIVHVSNDSRRTPTLLGDSCDLLAQAIGFSESKAMHELCISKFQWRSLGIELLHLAKQQDFNEEAFWEFAKSRLQIKKKSSSRGKSISGLVGKLKSCLFHDLTSSDAEHSSSIHRAKGLEADAVLVVAQTCKQLQAWLVKDQDQRAADKTDRCRLGYVASTRARELLCFACTKPIDDTTTEILADRGIKIV